MPNASLTAQALSRLVLVVLVAAGIGGCGEFARLSIAQGTGPNPTLPTPVTTLVPTVNVAKATGWPSGGKPIAAEGLVVTRFAEGLDHPRWLYVLPNGDVLVAETNAPPRPENSKGIKAA